MTIHADVQSLEKAQCNVDQMRALVRLIFNSYGDNHALQALTDEDISTIQLNLITLLDMLSMTYDDLDKAVREAYINNALK